MEDIKMKPKERFISALKGGTPDLIPLFDYLFSKKLYKEVLDLEFESYNNLAALKLAEALGHDGVFTMASLPENYKLNFISDCKYIDEWGTTYKINKSSWPFNAPINYSIRDENDLQSFDLPNPNDESRYYSIIEAIENNKKSIAIIGGVGGPFTQAAIIIGLERLSIMAIDNIKFIKELFLITAEYALNQINMLKKIKVDVINISDDLGYSTSTFFSPQWYEEYLFPCYKQLVDEIKHNNLPVFLHSDGNLNSIIGYLIDLGFDGLNPIERKANMSIKTIRKKYGTKLCLIGNVDSSKILVFGKEEDVEIETLECIRDGGMEGAYILASDHSFHDDIPKENIFKIIKIRNKFGKYPIRCTI
jgi:uroporphyrinogen decarboxylase